MPNHSGAFSVRMEPEKQKKLEAIAAQQDRSRSYVVNQAIDYYLSLHEWQVEQIQSAVAYADSAEAEFITHDEVAGLLDKHQS